MEQEDIFITKMFKRENRNQLLRETDKYLLPDYPITVEKLELIKTYRQQLRDYTNLDGFVNYNTTPFPEFPILPF